MLVAGELAYSGYIVFAPPNVASSGMPNRLPNSSCTVPSGQLEGRHLVGQWEFKGATMNIYCNGTFSTNTVRYGALNSAFSRGTMSNTSSGQRIVEVNDKNFIVGTFLSSARDVYDVQSWPHETVTGWQMKIDDEIWTRVSTDSCH